jgi:ribosomal protein L11 methyltransferase
MDCPSQQESMDMNEAPLTTGESVAFPRRLFVYECRAARSPRTEPDTPGFLGLWPEAPFYYLFFDTEAEDSVRQWLKLEPGCSLQNRYTLNYEEWQQVAASDQRVGPFRIRTGEGGGGDLPSDDALLLRMNPGLVFGSGLHPTTKGCLLALHRLFHHFPVQTVVDLGTGTGILAVAAALLGAARVTALDCIPLAVRVARDNVKANAVEHVVSLVAARELKALREPSELLLMNIEWPCLREALAGEEWQTYRWVVMSGFLTAQWDAFHALLPPDCQILFQFPLEDWMTVVVSPPTK